MAKESKEVDFKESREKKPRVTYVEFTRENGTQIRQPNGDFLRYIRETKESNKAAFHIIGITDIKVTPEELIIVLDDKIERRFPKQSISNYTVE